MSKLTHSTDEGMRKTEEYRAREDGEVPLWKRVYQGGHHDIWCDGERHRRTRGGFCNPDNPAAFNGAGHEFKCNCAYYRRETLNDAAPDMLAALKEAKYFFSEDFPDGPDAANIATPRYEEAYRAILAAIAKAEGRTP